MWPYLYNDFTEGMIFFRSGSTETRFLNIHVYENRLHFIDGENISELKSTGNIAKVEIAQVCFVPYAGSFYQLLSKGDSGVSLVLLTTGNFESLLQSSGAYGSSANSNSTQQLSSIEGTWRAGGTNHMNVKNNKSAGKEIPLVKKYFYLSGIELIPAKAKDVEKSLDDPAQKKAFTAFVKANKINWNRPDDLVKLLEVL